MRAAAIIETKTVTRMVEQTEHVRVVTLALSEKQAQTLLIVSELIGGHPETTRRGDVDEIRKALERAGVSIRDLVLYSDARRRFFTSGATSLNFKEGV